MYFVWVFFLNTTETPQIGFIVPNEPVCAYIYK